MPCTVERLGVGREPTPAILAFLSEPPEVVSFWISFFPVLLFKVFSRFLFFGKVGTICHDIVNLQTFLLLYLVRYTSILSKIYPLVITMVTHANGLQTRALVDQVYTGIKKCLVYCTNTYLMAVETGSWDFWKQIFLFRCSSSLSQSPLTAEWPRSWSGTAASGLGIC